MDKLKEIFDYCIWIVEQNPDCINYMYGEASGAWKMYTDIFPEQLEEASKLWNECLDKLVKYM